jgi:hypothetical protein
MLLSYTFLMNGLSTMTFAASVKTLSQSHCLCDKLFEMIEAHAIFGSDRQPPVEIQFAIFLNHAGHYGNAFTIQDITDWAGVSVGTAHNCTNCIQHVSPSCIDAAVETLGGGKPRKCAAIQHQ